MSNIARTCWGAALAFVLVGCSPTDDGPLAQRTQELPAGCTALGDGITDHSCSHAINGPTVAVTASATRTFAGATPNVNAAHTHYEVTLPGPLGSNEGTVKFKVTRSGDWAIYVGPNVSITVLDSAGNTLPVLLQHATSSCTQLAKVVVVNLTKNAEYRIVLGPASVSLVNLVAEKVTDFNTFYFLDADVDTYGDPNTYVITACAPPSGHVESDTDCNDASAAINPGATEVCGNAVDENCDGVSCP
jgi:hypothetical protein